MASSLSALMAAIRAPTMVVSAPPPPSAQGWLVHSWATEKKEPSLSSLPLSRVQTYLRRHRNGNNHASNFQMNRSFTPPSSSASSSAPLSLGRRGEGEGPTDQEGTLPPSLRRYVRRGGEEGGGQLANFFGLAVGVRSLRGSQAMCGQATLEEQQHFFSEGEDRGGASHDGGLRVRCSREENSAPPPLLAGLLLDTLPPSVGTYTHVRRAHPQLSSPKTLLLPF